MITDTITRLCLLLKADEELVGLLGGLFIFEARSPKEELYPRITLFELDNTDGAWADDTPFASVISVQIDVWGKTSPTAIAARVDAIMKREDWRRTSAADLYESDNKIFHKALRYRTSVLINEEVD